MNRPFPDPAPVWIHHSQQAEAVAQARRRCLAENALDPAFHYVSPRQSQLWLEVFQKHSPVNGQADFERIYREMFLNLAETWQHPEAHIIGLGTGSGLKDAWLIEALKKRNIRTRFTPVDVSASLALLAARTAQAAGVDEEQRPLQCDLLRFPELTQWLSTFDGGAPRIFTFFGLFPNMEPDAACTMLSALLRPQDRLSVSAHLSPALDESADAYRFGCEQILPQYDNPETVRWLSAVLADWGLAARLETPRFTVAPYGELLAVTLKSRWLAAEPLEWEGECLPHAQGQEFRLFFSVRYTPGRFESLLSRYQLHTQSRQLSGCKQEGVWLLSRA